MSDVRPRVYESMLRSHFASNRQMAFLAGPRQVGKTTISQDLAGRDHLLNCDNLNHRSVILRGPEAVAARLGLMELRTGVPIIAFDELHKLRNWKGFLKGFFDEFSGRAKVVVTGSSRLDVFRRGSDSLMGRYFLYHMHPFTVAELLRTETPDSIILPPAPLPEEEWEALMTYGGYPEPFLKRDRRFTIRWQTLRHHQLLREDVRDLTRVQELAQMEMLGMVLAERSGQQLSYTNVARDIQVSVDTARRWVEILRCLHFGFLVRPWFKNVAKSLRKEPKWYLRDWSEVTNPGARAETFIACHLLKAVDAWNDLGLGHFELRYLRDKQHREVDFVVVRDRQPWILIEVKQGNANISPALVYYQKQLKASHAMVVVIDMPYVQADCFAVKDPVVVPARTLLSQLV